MLIELAAFSHFEEANGYATVLRKTGITTYIEASNWSGDIDLRNPEQGPYLLYVEEEDEEDAKLVMESTVWTPAPPDQGQEKMLVGGILSGVGLLTTLGAPDMVSEPWTWLPYGMIIAGLALFLKGSKEEAA